MQVLNVSEQVEALSFPVAAAILGTDWWGVRYLVRSGKLAASYRVDGHRYVTRESVEAYVASRRGDAVPA